MKKRKKSYIKPETEIDSALYTADYILCKALDIGEYWLSEALEEL